MDLPASDPLAASAAALGGVLALGLRPPHPGRVAAALCALPAGELRRPAQPLARLTVLLTPAQLSGGLEGGPVQSFRAARYAVFLTPAGRAALWHSAQPRRQLCLLFDAGAPAWPALGGPLLNAAVPGIRDLVDELAAELQPGDDASAAAADSLARLLLIKVLRAQERRAPGGGLTPQRLQRLTEHVQAHLGEKLRVADLAATVGLAPTPFARACAASTGQSPHQFLLGQRLRRAQALLAHEALPLAQVAAECGFASQQHLTQVMRRRLGVTPHRYRLASAAAA